MALVHRPRYDDWTLPKGKQEPGEHLLLTAIREVGEESGLRVRLGRPLAAQEYPVNGKVKQVRYWAGRCAAATTFMPSHEVDQMRWQPASEAAAVLTYPRDAAVLADFLAGPADTVPVIVLRHAEAGNKHERIAGRPGPAVVAADLSRPLDVAGTAQAQALAALLACYGPSQVISSRAERCLATVRPYAAASGAAVRTEDVLTVEIGADGSRTRECSGQAARLAASLAVAGEPVIFCAHRENLPALISAVFRALGADPPPEPLAKAEFVIAHVADRKLAGVERHRPGELRRPATLGSMITAIFPRLRGRASVIMDLAARGSRTVGGARYKTATRFSEHREDEMADDISRAVESELADLAERLTAPGRAECLRCYLLRMITEFGCDGTYRWTIRWRDVRAAKPGSLLGQLERRGGCCDCEVLMNVFPDYPPVSVALPCTGTGRAASWRACDLGLRRSA